MATPTRRAAWRPGPANGWTDDFIWYAAAINRMRSLSPGFDEAMPLFRSLRSGQLSPQEGQRLATIIRGWSDPAGLGYQSQVHASYLGAASWPTYQGHDVLWHECAHSNWFFLPWHRAYLLEFEAVVRSHIKTLGGPHDTWALPYWNYSDYVKNPQAAGLPRPLRGEFLPAGVTVKGVTAVNGKMPNPLFIPNRAMTGANATPTTPSSGAWMDASDALGRHHFATRQDSTFASFGGGYLDPGSDFHSADEMGMLDASPHGATHSQVGGNMGQFETAALDPAFWLHHANIDRLWETYAHDLQHGYPFPPASPTGTERTSWEKRQFKFLRPDGKVGTWTPPKVLDITKLGYAYDTTAPPTLVPSPVGPPPGQDDNPFGLATTQRSPVSASEPIELADAMDVHLTGGDDGDDGSAFLGTNQRWSLRFDGVRSERPAPTSYQVFLGLGPTAAADPTDLDHFVGVMTLFGVFEASRDDGTAAGTGRRRQFDVTMVVRAQPASFDPLHPVVRLVPINPERDLLGAGVTVEQMTLELV